MATLATLRGQVRRDLHDLTKPQEQIVDAEPDKIVYPIPTLGPISAGTMVLDVDGTVIDPANYTLYESGFVKFTSAPVGSIVHTVFEWARNSDQDLNQFIQEAIREFSIVNPKQNNRYRTPVNLQTAHLALAYAPGDGQFVVDTTAGYDPRGILQVGSSLYMYTDKDASHFLGLIIWAGPDAIHNINDICIQNDNTNHGWVLDPKITRYVYQLHGYEPTDEFGIGSGYNEIAYFNYDEVTGYLHLEFDFSQLETGSGGADALVPLDQFKVVTGEYYAVPVNDTDTLEIPDYAINPVSWLAAALAAESREGDRDASWREQAGADTTADPVLTYQKVGAANRKKWDDWVKAQFMPIPRSRRRMYSL